MAETKKPAAKKAAPKKTEHKSTVELLIDARADLLAAQKSHAAGELVNPRILGKYRKDIARLMTMVNAEKKGA